MSRYEIGRIDTAQIDATVRMWRRSREEAQPEIEARMGYNARDDLAFFSDGILKSCDVWVAILDSRPIGFLALNQRMVEHLYVEPDVQRKGVGTALLDFAKERSPRGLRLHTHQTNLRARRFYEQMGFRPVAFGISPPPESEPDVTYEWDGPDSKPAA